MNLSPEYLRYIKTPAWQKKRSLRLAIDNYTCQHPKCGSKRDLDVHHITYRSFGDENVYTDLITLCRKHHDEVEKNKKEAPLTEREKKVIATRILTLDFCYMNQENDYSGGGNINLCKNDEIRPLLYNFLRERGNDGSMLMVKMVNDFFRDKRYEVMEKIFLTNTSITAWEMHEQTGFKYNMVDKWLKAKRRTK